MSVSSVTGIIQPTTSKPVGDYVGRFGRLGPHCWEIKEPVRATYYNEIRPAILAHLDRRVGSVSSQSSIIIVAYMMGRRSTTAAPTVLFVSEDANGRKEARKVVKDSGILSPYRGWKTAQASTDPRWGGDLEQLASGRQAGNVKHPQHSATQVLYNPAQPIKAQGMTLYLELNSEIRTFTASLIRINGTPLYLGPAHTFFPRLDAPASHPLDTSDDFEIDSDDETETILANDEYPDAAMVEFSSEAESSSDDSGSSMEYSDFEDSSSEYSDFSMEFSDFEAHSQSSFNSFEEETLTVPISHNDALHAAEVRPRMLIQEAYTPPLRSLAPFGVLSQWSTDKDWALIEVQQHNDTSIDAFCTGHHDELSSLKTTRPGPAGAAVVTQTTSGGRQTGTISGTTSDIRVPHGKSFQEVFSVKLDGALADGDCGSIVVDANTGELYGHIIAGCQVTGFAYVMAASDILPDLPVYLSEEDEEVDIVETRPINFGLADLAVQNRGAPLMSRVESLRDLSHMVKEHTKGPDSIRNRTYPNIYPWSDLVAILDFDRLSLLAPHWDRPKSLSPIHENTVLPPWLPSEARFVTRAAGPGVFGEIYHYAFGGTSQYVSQYKLYEIHIGLVSDSS
jgi:hypothetical protein